MFQQRSSKTNKQSQNENGLFKPNRPCQVARTVTVTESISAAEEALSNLLGVEVPLDDGVEGAADFFAEKLGLQPQNSAMQTTVFVLTKAAILETASLVGLGSGLAKLDLMSFKLAQLAKQVEHQVKRYTLGPSEIGSGLLWQSNAPLGE